MEEHPPFVTVYLPIAGWKAILYIWDEEIQSYTPGQTGFFAYDTRDEARHDAIAWAEAEDLEYRD